MSENFQDFLKNIQQDDNQAWDKLFITTDIIITHWAEERRLEILWYADKSGVVTKEKYIQLVIKELKLFLEKGYEIYDFSSLKQAILDISQKLLDEGFRYFMNLIFTKDKKAWNIFCDVIKIKIYRFLRMEGYSQVNNFDEIFQETLIVFAEKSAFENLEFVNSYKLKSFMLRVAQLKLYEKFRLSKKQKDSLWIDEMNYNLPESVNCQNVFEDREYAAYLFKKLEKKEQLIIHYYFFDQKPLKEIAKQLDISEENCRIIKYRAIRKLRDVVGQNKKMQIL